MKITKKELLTIKTVQKELAVAWMSGTLEKAFCALYADIEEANKHRPFRINDDDFWKDITKRILVKELIVK